jgi:hypothetical protein
MMGPVCIERFGRNGTTISISTTTGAQCAKTTLPGNNNEDEDARIYWRSRLIIRRLWTKASAGGIAAVTYSDHAITTTPLMYGPSIKRPGTLTRKKETADILDLGGINNNDKCADLHVVNYKNNH